MRILITGATGLLGNNIVRLAQSQGHELVALIRSSQIPDSLQGLDIETIHGELRSVEPGHRAFGKPIDAIIHCAAHIHIGWKFLTQALEVNRDGTTHMLQLAAKLNARFIHVSTVNTLPVGERTRVIDEDSPGLDQIPCTYVTSKKAAEAQASLAAAHGQDVVIVHPGFMLGPWDWKPSSGRMIREIKRIGPPLAPAGGCSVCDPRDVGQAILQATSDGQSGRHYILAGENISYFDLWCRIAKAVGGRPPLTYMRLPGRWIASRVGDLMNRFRNEESEINSAAIGMASQFHWYSSQRAVTELAYRIRPIDDSIRDAAQWLAEHNYL